MHWFIRCLIYYSVAMYFIETEFSNDAHSKGFYLWSERFVASIFTIEYFYHWCWSLDKKMYPFNWHSIIDIISVLPFWIGYFIDVEYLAWVRTLRIVRLLKLNRHNNALRHLRHAFYNIRNEMAVVGFVCLLLIIFGSVLIFEIERYAQPDKFVKISDAIWYTIVTLTTVGYGDLAPVTQVGRWIAVVIMIAGIGIFGTFISLLGSRLVEEFRYERDKQEIRSKKE